jgi:hypothetical protein
MILELPLELVTAIFSYLDPNAAQRFSQTSKQIHQIVSHRSPRAQLLLKYYGKGQALFYAYCNHRSIMDGALASILIKNKAKFPRFLAQLIVKDVSLFNQFQSRSNKNTNTSLYVYVVNYGFEYFQDEVEFKANVF